MPTVRTVNNHGDSVSLQVSDDMLETLRGKVRKDELQSVEVISDSNDADAFVEVPVEYRPRPAVLAGVATDETPEPVVVIDERKSAPGQVVPDVDEDDADLDALRAEYEELYGSAPDGRWKPDTLRRRIAEKQG